MTLRKIAIALVSIPAIAGFVACNSDYEVVEESIGSAAVRTFSFAADDSVLENLDSVFFSIDLVKGLIFNADSLPVGTKVTKLVPVISTLQGASMIQLKVTRSNNTDTTYNYLTNSTDSIDFTNPVTLRVVSPNGVTERTYTITVNVHKTVADSLAWGDNAAMRLPSEFAVPEAQRTVRRGDDLFCLTAKGNQYSIGTHIGDINDLNGASMNPNEWRVSRVNFPFTPDVNTFAATDDALYILAADGTLYRSLDDGATWQSTSLKWHSIYGGYQSSIMGAVNDGGAWKIQTYPGGSATALPAGMPVSGNSVPVCYSFPMSRLPQMLIVGGRKADGTLTGACWGFDGTSWAKVSKRDLPAELENIAVAPYFSIRLGSDWNATSLPTLVAIGGNDTEGKLSEIVYISNDYGFTWAKASQLMQLPKNVGTMTNAQAYVMESTFHATIAQPKIAKPTETWQCPYIYLFGGNDANGQLRDKVWRGAINRLSFRPIE